MAGKLIRNIIDQEQHEKVAYTVGGLSKAEPSVKEIEDREKMQFNPGNSDVKECFLLIFDWNMRKVLFIKEKQEKADREIFVAG